MHEDGILRFGVRLENSQLPFDTKHQFIGPVSHCLATLIINDTHMKTMHGGAQLNMSTVRENFWIPVLKGKVKAVINSCVVCFTATYGSVTRSTCSAFICIYECWCGLCKYYCH